MDSQSDTHKFLCNVTNRHNLNTTIEIDLFTQKPKLIKIQQQSLTFMLNINQSINSTVTLTIALSFVSCENLRTKS